MPKQFVDRDSKGEISKVMPDVVVEYLGNKPLIWANQNYVGDGRDMIFNFIPHQKETLEQAYAKRIFGDWDIDPHASSTARLEWRNMIRDRALRSPSCDGKLPRARIYSSDGTLLWDTMEQFSKYLAETGQPDLSLPIQESEGFSIGPQPIPEFLKNADGDKLKELWLELFGHKMPAGMQHELAKKLLVPYLKAEHLQPELQAQAAVSVNIPPGHVRHYDERVKIQGGKPSDMNEED